MQSDVPPRTGATATELFLPLPSEGGRHGSHSRSVATAPGIRDTKESAVTPEMTKSETRPADPARERTGRPEKLRNIEVWARSAPIRLAGYEDDLAEPHILPGID